ncbi:pyridoxine 5'-phosphate synthase [Roseomonas sp. NAR14]|uniref:Pyridoxine 5'-phosphate synthase n=1 Tax=Roseomonas acroporae TaxID=2937791 RepID=A0A9X2BXA3_9PROT|nr:pyridoxine 5'-phosphate synthase [Roseomonas acroporae]MCK8784785.1 pyridoxine 5'-phosphate synthase [Roseomonas acroporae]
MQRLRLSVNVDHVATLRNARGGTFPDPVEAARLAIEAGADGITVHLREDRRHIRDADVLRLRAEVPTRLNFEMAATEEMVAFACGLRPEACCIVPEKRAELTTEGGLDVLRFAESLAPQVARLAAAGIEVAIFVEPDAAQIAACHLIGAAAVELHTGAYAEAGGAAREAHLARLRNGATAARSAGLSCHAGHGLTYGNVSPVAALPELSEVSIGHFLIAQSVFEGLPAAIARMRALLDAARGDTVPGDGVPGDAAEDAVP